MPGKLGLVLTFLILSLSLIVPSTLFAQGRPSNLPTPRGQQASRSAENAQRACEARQTAVKNRSEQLVRRANEMLDKFGQISNRAQEFYTNKVVPTGTSIPNYSDLVSDVASRSAVVMDTLDQASATAKAIDCNTGDIKKQIQDFNTDARDVISALKEYRRSIRNLIVEIHSANGEQASQPATNSGNLNRGGKNR